MSQVVDYFLADLHDKLGPSEFRDFVSGFLEEGYLAPTDPKWAEMSAEEWAKHLEERPEEAEHLESLMQSIGFDPKA